MGDIVNLNKYRKQRQCTEQTKQAAENRVRFGEPKARKMAAKLEAERARRELEGKKRD